MLIPVAIALLAATPDPDFEIAPLGDGVWAALYTITGTAVSNAGIIDLGDQTVVIDSFMSPETSKKLYAKAKELTGHDVTFVALTHRHGDHGFGLGGAPKSTRVIGTAQQRADLLAQIPKDIDAELKDEVDELKENTDKLAAAKTPWEKDEAQMMVSEVKGYQAALPTLRTPRAPDVLFTDTLEIVGSKRTVTLVDVGAAHTKSDVFAFVKDAGVVFCGDLLFIGVHPYVRDGDLEGWGKALARIDALGAKKLVPGHGKVGGHDDIVHMQQYFKALNDAVAGVKTIEDAAKVAVPAQFADWHYRYFWGSDMKATFEKKNKK